MTDTAEKKQRKNITDILLGIGLALLVYISASIAYYQYQGYLRSAPASNWVEVTSLIVPNFNKGVDPAIDYVREIKQSVSSAWTAELRYYDNGGNYTVVCSKSGFSELEPGRTPPSTGWTLGSFAGKECVEGVTTPGDYRLYLTWILSPRGLDRTIHYPVTSNTFVIAEGV